MSRIADAEGATLTDRTDDEMCGVLPEHGAWHEPVMTAIHELCTEEDHPCQEYWTVQLAPEKPWISLAPARSLVVDTISATNTVWNRTYTEELTHIFSFLNSFTEANTLCSTIRDRAELYEEKTYPSPPSAGFLWKSRLAFSGAFLQEDILSLAAGLNVPSSTINQSVPVEIKIEFLLNDMDTVAATIEEKWKRGNYENI